MKIYSIIICVSMECDKMDDVCIGTDQAVVKRMPKTILLDWSLIVSHDLCRAELY